MIDGAQARARTLRPSAAATLMRRAPHHLRSRHLFAPGETLASPESGLQYQIERFLGEGGFGQVYLARRLGRSNVVPRALCIKASLHIDGWLREVYFGRLLHRDLTPLNVLVCEGRRLKIGDFGIVRQQSDGRGITARTLNAITAPAGTAASS